MSSDKLQVAGGNGSVYGGTLDEQVMLACAAWEKDCQDPELLRMYVAPVVGKSSLALVLDPEWQSTLAEWESCGADEAYLPDFVLAYAEVATGAVLVGPLTEDREFYVKYDALRSRIQELESELRKADTRTAMATFMLHEIVALESVDPDGLKWTWKELFTTAQQLARKGLSMELAE